MADAQIVFADNTFADGSNSPVVATTIPHFRPVSRNEPITWLLVYDEVKTIKFDPKKVGISFKSFFTPIKDKKPSGDIIQAVVKDKREILEGRYSYQITYDKMVAQDPELDIKGDMVKEPKVRAKKGAKKQRGWAR